MGGIIERAISALIDEQLVAATLLDLHDHRVELGRQGTARLAPQFRRVGHRQRFSGAVDRGEIILQRRGSMPG
jgi:hypothetical protein